MRSAFFLAFLLTPTIASADDLTIVSKLTKDGGRAETATSYISTDHLRIAQPEGDFMFDLKSGDMTVLDLKKKTYYVVTKKDLDAMAAMVQKQMNSPEMKQAQEQMKNLPPEVRKQMEARMGGMLSVEVKKIGTTRKIAGYKCENWTVQIGQMSKSEHCLTNELKFPAQSWQAYRSFVDTMTSLTGAMGPMAKGMGTMKDQLQKMKGYPLATTTMTSVMGRQSVTASEVTSVKQGPIPPSAWQIPAGYKKVANPMMKALEGSGRR